MISLARTKKIVVVNCCIIEKPTVSYVLLCEIFLVHTCFIHFRDGRRANGLSLSNHYQVGSLYVINKYSLIHFTL